jgi:hypothetical protein
MKETTAIVIVAVAFLAFSFGYFYFKEEPEKPVKEVSVEIDWSNAELGDIHITVPGCSDYSVFVDKEGDKIFISNCDNMPFKVQRFLDNIKKSPDYTEMFRINNNGFK